MKQGTLRRRLAVRLFAAITALLAWASPSLAAGQPVVVTGERQVEAIDDRVLFVEDRERRIDPDRVLTDPGLLAWMPAGKQLLRGGISRSRWWMRIDLHNADDTARERVLMINHPSLDEIRVAFSCDDGTHTRFSGGNSIPLASWPLPNRLPAFPVSIGAGAHCTALFAVTDGDSFRFPVRMHDGNSYRHAALYDYRARGLTYGMQALLAMIGLLLAVLFRDRLSAWFALAVFSQTAMTVVFSNTGYSMFWSEAPGFQKAASPAVLALAWWFTAAFCLRLLPEDVWRSVPAQLVRGVSLLALAAALLQILLPDPGHISLLVAIVTTGLLLLLSMAVGAAMLGAAEATLAIAGIGVIAMAGIVEAASWLGLLPFDITFLMPLHSGLIVSDAIFAAVLARHIGARRMHRRADYELNRRVAERTREITSTIAQLTSQNRRLDRLSSSDPLTGTYNRRFLDSCLPAAARDPASLPLSFILFDIDFFKQVNDRHGHGAGDQCLRQVAARVQQQLREHQDFLCRYGGEEFAIVLPKTDREGASVVAEKIRQAVAATPIRCEGGKELEVTISLGVATLLSETDLPRLVDNADLALYDAKKNGRNRCQLAPA